MKILSMYCPSPALRMRRIWTVCNKKEMIRRGQGAQ